MSYKKNQLGNSEVDDIKYYYNLFSTMPLDKNIWFVA